MGHVEMLDEPVVVVEADPPSHDLAHRRAGAVVAPPAANDSSKLLAIIERVATDPAADIEKMERLLAMHERMKSRAAEEAFNEAMCKAQSEMGRVSADAVNPQTLSQYVTYGKLDAAARPIYTRHGFSISFNEGEGAPEGFARILAYVSRAGFTRTYKMDMPADGKGAKGGDVMTKTHATGSAHSYGKRYLLKDIFNIAIGEEDDDGNAAGGELGADGFARGYTPSPPPAQLYPDTDFKKNLPAWRKAIESGKTTAAAVIAKVQTKAPLSKQQQAQIHGQ